MIQSGECDDCPYPEAREKVVHAVLYLAQFVESNASRLRSEENAGPLRLLAHSLLLTERHRSDRKDNRVSSAHGFRFVLSLIVKTPKCEAAIGPETTRNRFSS